MIQQKKINKTDLEEFLEGGENINPAQNKAKNFIKDAKELGIDLDFLENPEKPNIKSMPEESMKRQKVAQKAFWEDFDISLGDVVKFVLSSSERPVIMVSDDKIVYFNYATMQLLEMVNTKSVEGEPFLSFVEKDDWNLMSENIGDMLTNSKKLSIRMKTISGKAIPVEFQAIYLPDSTRFSFILIGAHTSKSNKPFFNNLYDEITGLPNFFLFEDRVQMAVNNENYKNSRLSKDLIAVAVVNIDNLEMFRKLHLEEFAIKKLANTLVLSLKKNYTVARGLKYSFWILMPDILTKHDFDVEMERLLSIFKEGITDYFTNHEVVVSIGASLFPKPARSAKKLVEQSIEALKIAQKEKKSSMNVFEE